MKQRPSDNCNAIAGVETIKTNCYREMESYDRLPKAVREALQQTAFPMTAEGLEEVAVVYGERVAVRAVLLTNEQLLAQAYAETGAPR